MNFDFANTTFALLFLTIFGIFLWYYLCVVLPYSKMPSYRTELYLMKLFLSRKRITTNGFKKLISLGRKFMPEDRFVLWMIKPYLIIFNEEDVKAIMNSNLNKAAEYRVLNELLGQGIFTSERGVWRKHRKMFNPLFRMTELRDKVCIFNKQSRNLVQELDKVAKTASVEPEKLLKIFSFDVLCEAVFGIKAQDSNMDKELLIGLIDQCAEFMTIRIVKPWLYFMKLFPSGRMYLQNIRKIDELATKQLIEMKDSVLSRMASEKALEDESELRCSGKSFAEILLEHHVRDPSFTVEDMLSEIKTFIIGGYDTISCSLNWSLFTLGQYPDVQDRICEELRSYPGDLTFEDLQNLKYTECVIMETLRLYPPLPMFGRCLDKDMKLGNHEIPKGTTVGIFVYIHHRNPDIFPDPDRFDPGRFLDGNLVKSPWSHIPFSSGIRNCLGQKFAMMEMKIALAHILRHFHISSTANTNSFSWELLLKPEEPLRIKLTPRLYPMH